MSKKVGSVLAGFCDHCPSCNKEFSASPDNDGSRTYLSCGHSVCFKCIQTEWCNSSSNDVDLVNCPICNVEVLICFERQASNEQHLQTSRNTISMQQVHSSPPNTHPPASGCSDVLISQNTESSQGNFPLKIPDSFIDMVEFDPDFTENHSGHAKHSTSRSVCLPLSIADSIIDMVEMTSSFSASDHPENLDERSWPMDIMSFHDMLEKNDATQHLRQDSIFSEQMDSDMGSVQDILKIAHIPGDSLLDENSLGSMFLQENSNESHESRDNLKNSGSSSGISDLSVNQFHSHTSMGQQPSLQENSSSSYIIPQRDIRQITDQNNFGIIDRLGTQVLKSDNYTMCAKTRKRNCRGRKRNVLSRAATSDSINMETLSAVASIQEDNNSHDLPIHLPERRLSEKLLALKGNLHERFYPKTKRGTCRRRTASPVRRQKEKVICQNQDEIDIPDMQMVKIVSDVQIPEVVDQPTSESDDSDSHNYGYVKNSLLPNGNEIKNLYVVPKTWLNKDEVATQFEPSQPEVHKEQVQCNNRPVEEMMNVETPLIQVDQPIPNRLPSDHVLVEQVPTQQFVHPVSTNDSQDNFLINSTYDRCLAGGDGERKTQQNGDNMNLREMNAFSNFTSQNIQLQNNFRTIHPDQIPHIVHSTTVAKSLLDHKHKVIKVWSKDTKSRNIGKEVHITQLPQPDLICGDNFETEMVRVHYEVNNGQIVFIPQDGSPENKRNTFEKGDENEPLLILTVNDNDLCTSDNDRSLSETKPVYQNSEGCENVTRNDSLNQNGEHRAKECNASRRLSATKLHKSSSNNMVSRTSPMRSQSKDSMGGSGSHNPSASNSNVSCQVLFSSPESVRQEDMQAWYKSSDNSREDSKLELLPWEDRETDSHSRPQPECSVIDANSTISLQRLRSVPSITLPIQTHSVSQPENIKRSGSCVSAAIIPSSSGTYTEGTDYGSPPELEIMVSPENIASTSDLKSRLSSQPSCSKLPSCSTSDLADRGADTSVPNQKPDESADQFHLNRLNDLLAELSELTQDECDLPIEKLKNELNKMKDFEAEKHSSHNENCRKIYDLILNQLVSLITCAKVTSQLKSNADDYSKSTAEIILDQNKLVSEVLKHGKTLVSALCSEYKRFAKPTLSDSDTLEYSECASFDNVHCPYLNTEGQTIPSKCHNTQNDEDLSFQEAQAEKQSDPKISEGGQCHTHNTRMERFLGVDLVGSHEVDTVPEYPLKLTDEDLNDLQTYQSCSKSSVISKVSSIALNVEIDASESAESILPSLSEVLRENNINQENTLTVITLKPKDCWKRELNVGPDPELEKNVCNEDSDDEEEDNDDDDDDKKDKDFEPSRKPPVQPRPSKGKTLKRKRQYDDQNKSPGKSISAVPKKKPNYGGKGKQPKNTSRKGVKRGRKKGKGKDIEASSSEEIIPAPVKRGFQYTDECFKVFNIVYNHESSDPFCKEIKSDDVPGYYKVVKRAMWLDLIAGKLRTGKYTYLEQYVADMRLVFENSRRFNKKDSDVYKSGLVCERLFEKVLAEQFPDRNL